MRSTCLACVAILSAVCLLNSPAASQAGQFYANGNNINLASGRNNTYSTGGSIGGQGLLAPLYPQYGNIDFRASTSIDGPYWQVNFPKAYEVSTVYVETYDPGAQILTMNVQTTTDGSTWTTQATPAVAGNSLNATFPAVTGVVGVRLVSTSADNPGTYPGIFRAVRITGPNTSLPINNATSPSQIGKSEFSVIQSTWNGGTLQSAVGWGPYNGGTAPGAIDDYTTTPWNYNQTIYRGAATNPAPIDVLMNDNYSIDTVAVVTGSDSRNTQAVSISYSPDAFSPFIPIPAATSVSLTGGGPLNYYVIPLGGQFDSRRLRFEFAGSNTGDGTFISELYAFATFTAVPEPSTGLLLLTGVGLAGMKRCRRRQATRG